jgi:hypothetical protein
MLAIYVQKSWLSSIGDIAQLVVLREEADDVVSLVAGPVRVNFPFVEAELARREVTEKGDVFISAKIPTAVITGIFDLTVGEAKKLGFHPPDAK